MMRCFALIHPTSLDRVVLASSSIFFQQGNLLDFLIDLWNEKNQRNENRNTIGGRDARMGRTDFWPLVSEFKGKC